MKNVAQERWGQASGKFKGPAERGVSVAQQGEAYFRARGPLGVMAHGFDEIGRASCRERV